MNSWIVTIFINTKVSEKTSETWILLLILYSFGQTSITEAVSKKSL